MMFWLLCLPFTKCLPGVECLFVVLLPLVGAMVGPDAVVRLSFIMMLHALITGVLPWTKSIPFFSTGLMVAMFAVPMDLVPAILIWAYSQLLWISEPLLMMLEAVAVVHFTLMSSRVLVGYINDNPVPAKSAILGMTFLSYATALSLGVLLWLTGGSSVRWVVGFLALTSIILLITTIVIDKGVISDCAVISLYLVWCLWVMQQENKLSAHPLKPPVTWERMKSNHSSVVQVVYSMFHLHLDNMSSSLSFFWALCSLTTVVMVLTRSLVISKATVIIKTLSQLIVDKDDDDDIDEWESDDEDSRRGGHCCGALYSTSSRSLPLKLAFLFVYTQLIVYNIENSLHPDMSWAFSINTQDLLPYKDLRILRLIQIVLSGGFYLWSLMRKEEDEDEDWY